MQIEGWLDRAAARAPGRIAVETPGCNWTYAELSALARLGAQHLAGLGVGPGDRVAIALAPGAGFVQALHSCLLAGAVAVPVDLRLAPGEQRRIADGASVLIEEPLPSTGASSWPAVRHELRAPALIVHTSGTTAAPRPVTLTYGNLLWSALGSGVALGVEERDRWLCALPLSHVGGLSILLRSAIYATSAVVHERFETDRVLAALADGGVTLVSLVATTLARLLDAGLERPPALRCALTGGGPVPAALVERAHAAGVPVEPDLRPHRDLLSGHDDPAGRARRRTGERGTATVLHTGRAGRGRRDPRLRTDRVPVGAAEATAAWRRGTSPAWTIRAVCGSPAARPTRSSAAGRTSPPPRSRPCSRPIRRCSRRPSWGVPTSSGASG